MARLLFVVGLVVVLAGTVLSGQFLWRANEHARDCDSGLVLIAIDTDSYLFEGQTVVPADLPPIVQRAASSDEACVTLRLDGDDTLGHFNTLASLAAAEDVRVSISFE